MVKVSVLYPNDPVGRFDMDYYCNTHMPMVQEKLGAACKGIAVEEGIGGATPFAVMGHLLFDSVEAFQSAFKPHAETLMGDVPNYTDIQPVIQVSSVKI